MPKKQKKRVKSNTGEKIIKEGEKRNIGYTINKNKGITAYHNKEVQNPRVKYRRKYEKAIKRRKGQVRDIKENESMIYGGEATGINPNVVRSVDLSHRGGN